MQVRQQVRRRDDLQQLHPRRRQDVRQEFDDSQDLLERLVVESRKVLRPVPHVVDIILRRLEGLALLERPHERLQEILPDLPFLSDVGVPSLQKSHGTWC